MGKTYNAGLDVLGGGDQALVVYGDVIEPHELPLRFRVQRSPEPRESDGFGGVLVRVFVGLGVLVVMFFLDGAWRHVRLRP